jgi:hypothetical protein
MTILDESLPYTHFKLSAQFRYQSRYGLDMSYTWYTPGKRLQGLRQFKLFYRTYEWHETYAASVIGYTSRPAELGIPRTQTGRGGSGPVARRPSSLAAARPSPCRSSTYAVDLHRHRRHRTRPPGRARCRPDGLRSAPARAGTGLDHRAWPLVRPGLCRPDGSLSAPARAGTGLRHRTRLLTRPGPVPPARARRLWVGRAHSTSQHLHGSAG